MLVGTELWGFITPSTVDLALALSATAKVQPYYAVPSQFLAVDEFPTTRNGKVDKRALIGLAEGETTPGQKRLCVKNGGIPFSPTLPGTPNSINELLSFKWGRSGAVSPSTSETLSVSSQCCNSKDAQFASEQEEFSDAEDKPCLVLDGMPTIVCVDAV